MTRSRRGLCIVVLFVTLSAASHAATGYGHFILAREIIREASLGTRFRPN